MASKTTNKFSPEVRARAVGQGLDLLETRGWADRVHSILGGDPCHSITVAKDSPLFQSCSAPFSFLWK